MSATAPEPAIDALARLVPATLKALHALEFAGRHLAPESLPKLVEVMAGRDEDARDALAASRQLDWPGRLKPVRDCLEPAAETAVEGIAELRLAGEAPQPIVAAYRAVRRYAKAAESLYPLAPFLKPVNQFFLEPSARDDATLLERLSGVDEARTRGVILMAPTAQGPTWSLMEPELDGTAIERMVEHVASEWTIDQGHKLVSGMSD